MRTSRGLVAALIAAAACLGFAPSVGAVGLATVTGSVMVDGACDQRFDPLVDVGLPGMTVVLRDANRATVATAVSDASGRFRVTIPTGVLLTTFFLSKPSTSSGFVNSIVINATPGQVATRYIFLCANEFDPGFITNAHHWNIGGYAPVVGDWDGNGTTTPGIFRDGTWYLRNTNTPGGVDAFIPWGSPNDYPVAGDWDGDGKDTIGVYRSGLWLLRNSNSQGGVDVTYDFRTTNLLGQPVASARGDVPLVGDFDHNGTADLATFRSGTWMILFRGGTEHTATFVWGGPGDIPVVGDWDGDGSAGIGVVRSGTWYLRNVASGGGVDFQFGWGQGVGLDLPLTGDWDGDGKDSIAMVRTSGGQLWLERNATSAGGVDISFAWGGGFSWDPF